MNNTLKRIIRGRTVFVGVGNELRSDDAIGIAVIEKIQNIIDCPGSYQLLTETDIQHTGFSTHTLSLSVFMQYLKEASDADVYLLGVQPRSTDLGQGLTPQLEDSLEEIVNLIVDVCGHSLFLYPNEEETDNV